MSSICDDLRAAILQAAMQGKLTERFPDEKLDQKTRDALCSDIKNAPFEIPESWGYVNMGNVATHQNGYAFKPTDWKKEGLPIIRIQNLTDKKNTPHYTDGHGIDDKFHITKGDVLVSWSCTIDSFLYDGPDAVLNQHIFKVIFNKIPIDKEYYILGVKALLKTIDSKRHGSTMTHITKKDYDSLLFPIPPLAEQKRIVEKVDELMARVADLEQSADALASLKKAFPDDIKASLLQAAMQGKLTEQLPEDGNAEELLEQIKVEKEKLVAEGKIKKQKPLAPITDDEIPFSIPENWKWVRWGDIINIVSARRVHQSDWKKNGIPFYRAREIGKLADYDSVDNDLFVSQELFNEYSKSGLPKKNDLMVTAVGTLGKTYVVKESDKFYYKDASVLCFENYHCDPFFLKYLMSSDIMKSQIESNSGGTTVGTLTIVRMNDYILPLPPLDEQKRIVERLNVLIQNINVVGELIASE